MTQHIFDPGVNWPLYTNIETAPGSLAAPFNPDKVAELVNAAILPFGGIPPVAYLGCGPDDTLIGVGMINPTQQQRDNIMAALLAVCINPARNAQTQEQIDAAALAAELADINARIAETNANIALITTASPDPEAPLGYREAFKPANYNPLTQAQKLALVRASNAASLKTDLDTMRAVKYLLQRAKKESGM